MSRTAVRQGLPDGGRALRSTRTKVFTDKYPLVGPVVWVLSVLYFVAQVVASLGTKPLYSWAHNTISDLGNTACTPAWCSPRHRVMNLEFLVLGAVMALGALLIFQEFRERGRPERIGARFGFSALALGGLGAAIVGLVPENSPGILHAVGAALGIGVGTAGVLILGWALSLPRKLAWLMRAIPPFALLAGLLFALNVNLGLGHGTMERIAAYPETIWLVAFGVYMSRSHRR